MDTFLGLDIGSVNVKACLIDDDGTPFLLSRVMVKEIS
jgi:sugar (pentulose or hexulose) kinase